MDQDKKTRILDAAEARFAKFGFKKTSIDEVAAAASVAKGTVYLMCTSKEDLFYQVVHRDLREWCGAVAALLDPRLPAADLLATCSVTAFSYLDDHPLVRDLILGNYVETLPLWVDRLEDLRAIGRANTEEILRIGIRQGVFRADVDVERVARILQDLLAAGLLSAHRAKMGHDDQAVMAAAGLDLVLHGLVAKK
jgi:TetR/AcrR family transcriptional regulator